MATYFPKNKEEFLKIKGVGTILRHLEKCHNNGQLVDWSRFVDQNKEEKILSVISKIGAQKLRPIKEALPEDISYEDIRIVILKNNTAKEG